jgi:hypothetical protein
MCRAPVVLRLPGAPRAEARQSGPSGSQQRSQAGNCGHLGQRDLYTVATKTNFPQPSAADPTVVPLFHLVSVTAHTATISIAGGSYATGAPTVTLKENKPVTLMNTADGTRYTLVLKPLGTAVSTGTATSGSGKSGTGGTSTTPTSTTVTLPPPTP